MKRRRRATLSVCVVCMLGACGDPLYLLSEERIIQGDEEHFVSAACMQVAEGAPNSNSHDVLSAQVVSYTVSYEFHDDEGATVRVTIDAEPAAQRGYGRSFLESGRVDELFVELDPERTLHLTHRGGRDCDAFSGDE